MADRTLDDLVAKGLLQRKLADRRRVARWLARSRKDLDLAADLLAGIDRDRAMAVAYEAGYRACAGMLDLTGYRITSQPGHHRAAIDAATVVLGSERRALLRRLDRARRFRNQTLYGDVTTAGAKEFEQLLKDVAWLLEELARRAG
jgi:hypothetical protein